MNYLNQSVRHAFRRFDLDGNPVAGTLMTTQTGDNITAMSVDDHLKLFYYTNDGQDPPWVGNPIESRLEKVGLTENTWISTNSQRFYLETGQNGVPHLRLEECRSRSQDWVLYNFPSHWPVPPLPGPTQVEHLNYVADESSPLACYHPLEDGVHQGAVNIIRPVGDLKYAGLLRHSDGVFPDIEIEVRALAIRNLRVLNNRINAESPDPYIKVRGEFNILPNQVEHGMDAWIPDTDISWRVRLTDPFGNGYIFDNVTVANTPDTNGNIGQLSIDIDTSILPEGREVPYQISVIAIVTTDDDFDIVARPEPVSAIVTRCRCESEELLGNVRRTCPVNIWSSPLGNALNPTLEFSSFDCSSEPSSLGYGWSSLESSRVYELLDGSLSYRDSSGRFYKWTEDNGTYSPLYADNMMEISKDPASSTKRFTVTTREQTKMYFDDTGKLSSSEDRNGNTTIFEHTTAYFSASDGRGRTTYYHRTAAQPQPYVISDSPDPNNLSSRRYLLEYWGPTDLAPDRLKSVTNPVGDQTMFFYNENGLLTEERIVRPTEGNFSAYFEYYLEGHKDAGRLRVKTVHDQYQQVFAYETPIGGDIANLVFTQDLDANNNNPFRYVYNVLDDLGRLVKVYELYESTPEPRYNVTVHEYADLNDPYLRTKTIAPNGAITQWAFTARGNLETLTDAQGNQTVISYEEEDPSHPLFSLFPDLPTSIQRPEVEVNGVMVLYAPTEFSYDPNNGDLVAIKDSQGHISSFRYNSAGQPIEITNRRGFKTTLEYDPITANLIRMGVQKSLDPSQEDPIHDFRDVYFTYDAYDNIQTVVDDLGNTVTTVYDLLDRPTNMKDAKDVETILGYTDGLLKFTELPSNTASASDTSNLLPNKRRKVDFEYDIVGRMIEQKRDIGTGTSELRVRYKFDGFSQLRSLSRIKNGTEKSWDFSYDLRGRQVSTIDPLGKTREVAYEPFCTGNASTSAHGVRQKFDFDNLCRLVRVEAGDRDSNPSEKINIPMPSECRDFEYDELSRLIKTSQFAGTGTGATYGVATYGAATYGQIMASPEERTYEYDSLDRLTRLVFEDGKEMTYEYDEEGNVTKMTEDASSATPLVTRYAYFGDGRLATVTFERSGGNQVFNYSYDLAGRLASIEYPSSTGVFAYFDDGNGNSGWDENGQLLFLRYVKGLNEIRRLEYLYDDAGNRTHQKDIPQTGTAKLWVYEYDYLDRLSKVSLDTEPVAQAANLNEANATVQSMYLYDESDNMTQLDLSGINTEIYTFDYDDADNLEEKFLDSGSGPVSIEAFSSDDDGNMISRTWTENGDTHVINYEWDDFNKLNSVSATLNGNPAAEPKQANTFRVTGFRRKKTGKDGAVVSEYAEGLATAVAKSQVKTLTYLHGHQLLGFEDQSGNFFYFITDHLSSVRDIVRGSDGATLETYDFDERGRKTVVTSAGIDSPKTFVGGLSVNDDTDDSSLYLMGHRFYDPSIGRFLNRDPIGFEGGLNLFSYARNNPTTLVDFTGLLPEYIPPLGDSGGIPIHVLPSPGDTLVSNTNHRTATWTDKDRFKIFLDVRLEPAPGITHLTVIPESFAEFTRADSVAARRFETSETRPTIRKSTSQAFFDAKGPRHDVRFMVDIQRAPSRFAVHGKLVLKIVGLGPKGFVNAWEIIEYNETFERQGTLFLPCGQK